MYREFTVGPILPETADCAIDDSGIDLDEVVDGFAVRNGYGGFSTSTEVVVFTPTVFGGINTSTAASDFVFVA